MAQLLLLAPLVLLALGGVDAERYYNDYPRSYLGRDLYEHGRSISDNLVTCGPHTCGVGAHCIHGSVRPVCACLAGYSGDALTQCVRIECIDNSECRSHLTCVNQHCVDPCAGTCGVNANCEVRNHVPVCTCPPGYTGNPFSSCRIADPEEACHPSPCGDNTKCHVSNNQAICTCLPGYRGSPLTGCRHECESDGECGATQSCRDFKCASPCSDCGVNADCETVAAHRAICKCPRGYHGDPYRICSAECTSDGECPSYKPACIYNACVDPCINACGVNAECHLRGLTPVCSCPRNMTGDPFSYCRPFEARDLCEPNPCGANAKCTPGHDRTGAERPVCTCPVGYVGNALVSCERGECELDSQCPDQLACVGYRCVDPCLGNSQCGTGAVCMSRRHLAVCTCPNENSECISRQICKEDTCGVNAHCDVHNNDPICSCPPGYTGNPLHACRKAEPEEACYPSPCGTNTKCHIANNRPICTCLPGYLGNPLVKCHHECESDVECGATQSCRDFKCVSSCNHCGINARCDGVDDHHAICKCPIGYHGDPHRICTAECMSDVECPSFKPACVYNACVDPCMTACGANAECHLRGLTPVCSCPRNMTGDPFSRCRPLEPSDLCEPNPCGANAKCTPGYDPTGEDRPVCTCPVGYIGNALVSNKRGECEMHTDCPDQLACMGYICEDPCGVTQCGIGAVCMARRHLAICMCPKGGSGDALANCDDKQSVDAAGRKGRKH